MSRAYDIAFRLNGQLNGSYKNAFSQAQMIAQKTTGAIKSTIMGLAGIVISTAGIKDFVDTYKEYQQEITNTAAIAGVEVGSEQYAALDKAARDAGKATTKTAQESAAALGYMALAGWSAEESISGLMPVLRLSEATGADLATTSDLVTDSMSAMEMQVDDLTKYLDIAAQANNKSNQSATQLMEAYIECGGSFHRFNTELTESGALLMGLANRGKKGSEAGRSMQSIMANLTKQSGESYKAMQALGVSAYDANGNFIGFEKTLIKIRKALDALPDDEARNNYIQMIGGKTQTTAFNALLATATEVDEEGMTEYQRNVEYLEHSTGALTRMQETMNSTLSASFKLLNSAWDDFKINTVAQIEPYLTPIIRGLAEKLPGMTEKTIQFIHKSANAVQGLWSKGKGFFSWIGNNRDAIGTGLAGIGSAIVTYKLASTAVSAAKGIASLIAVAAANPAAVGFLAVAAGIGAVAYNVHRLKKESVDNSLAEHFDNISLSLAEIQDLSDSLFKDVSFVNMSESVNSLELADRYFKDFKDAAKEIDKLNFRVQLGLELGEADIENYKNQIESYINSALSTVDEKQYAINIALGEFVGADSDITKRLNEFYVNNREKVAELGTKMQEAVNDAFDNDGLLDIEEAKFIANYQRQMDELLNGVMDIEYESKLEALKIKYSGAELDAESYKQMIDEGTRIMAEYAKNADESLWASIAALKTDHQNDASYTTEQFQADLGTITQGYNEKIAALNNKVQELQTNTIMDTYGKDIQPYIKQVNDIINEAMQDMMLNLQQDGADVNAILQMTVNDIRTGISSMNIPEELRGALGEIYDSGILDQMLENASAFGENIPEYIRQGITSMAAIGALTGDVDSLWTLIGQKFSTQDAGVQAALKNANNSGEVIPQRVIQGMNIRMPKAVAEARSNAEKIMNAFAAGLNKTVSVNVKVNASMGGGSAFENIVNQGKQIKGFAGGTNYTPDTFIAGENGAELITNAAGYKVYDALETGRLFERARELWAEFDRNANNAAAVWAERSSMIDAVRESGAQRGGESNITVNMPQITINGNADSGTVQQIQALLETSKEDVVRAVLRVLEERESRKARLSN